MGLKDLRNRRRNQEGVSGQIGKPIEPVSQTVEQPIQSTYQQPVEHQGYKPSYNVVNQSTDQVVQNTQPSYRPSYQQPVVEPELIEHKQVVYQEPVHQEPVYQEPSYHQPAEPRVEHRFQHIEDGKVYDRMMTPVKAVEVPMVSEFQYSNPDNLGLQILGMDSTERIKLIKPKSLGIKPVEITNIVDSTGRVAAKLMKYMEKTSATVLPLRECGVFENIVDIKGFKIISIRGKKFASYCGSDFPKIYVDKLVNKIIDRISSAMPYGVEEDLDGIGGYIWNKSESRLSRVVAIHGREVEVPALCNSEIEYICAKFAPYNCNIIDVKDDFSHIIVGVDLEGVGYGDKEL